MTVPKVMSSSRPRRHVKEGGKKGKKGGEKRRKACLSEAGIISCATPATFDYLTITRFPKRGGEIKAPRIR
jgi:hypothetical protein